MGVHLGVSVGYYNYDLHFDCKDVNTWKWAKLLWSYIAFRPLAFVTAKVFLISQVIPGG